MSNTPKKVRAYEHPHAPHNQPFCAPAFVSKDSNKRGDTLPFVPNFSRRNSWFMKFKSNIAFAHAA